MLKKRNVPNVKELLESPNTSIVIVSGSIPAGANKGDTFDLEITLPEQSKTRSLQGGFLQLCDLYNYEAAKKLDPRSASDKWFQGHPLAKSSGAVLTGFGEGEVYIGSIAVTTDSSGNATITASLSGGSPLGNATTGYFTATATDPGGSTSEFSQALQLSR